MNLRSSRSWPRLHGIVSDRDISLETVFDTFIYSPPPKGAPAVGSQVFRGCLRHSQASAARYFPGKNLGDINRTTVTQYRNMNIPKVRGEGVLSATAPFERYLSSSACLQPFSPLMRASQRVFRSRSGRMPGCGSHLS